MQKTALLLLATAGLPLLTCQADPLTPADREALIEQLDGIRDGVVSKAAARFENAISAYRGAMSSPDATLAFYLKCVEKVDFTDRDRKAADFRNWKRDRREQLDDPAFALALRYQLRWLTITLQASNPKADKKVKAVVGADASEALESMFQDAPRLKGQVGVLSQTVLRTAFARAFDINRVADENWPGSLLPIDKVYEAAIFPPCREPGRVESLREAWERRIRQEGVLAENLPRVGRGGRVEQPDPAAADQFQLETRPQLEWEMEADLFQHGDQRAAAVRMLQHIQNNLSHQNAREWAAQFRELLKPKEAGATASAQP